jgi:hypothetical protein
LNVPPHPPRRLLRYTLVTFVSLLVAGALVGWLLLRASLPRIEGMVALAGLESQAWFRAMPRACR